MATSLCHCPHCTHCKTLRAEEMCDRMEEEERERQREERKRQHDEYLRNKEQGKIYGHSYHRYMPEDVKNIIDIGFLLSLSDNFWQRAQPMDDNEWSFYHSMKKAIEDRMNEILD